MGIVIRQSIKGTLVTYVGAFIGFITTMFIATKYLGDELFGLTRILVETATLFAVIFQLGTSASTVRFFPYFKSEDKKNNGFFFYMMLIASIGAMLFICLFLILKEPLASHFVQNSPLFSDYFNWLIPLAFFMLYWMVFETYSSVLMRIAVPKFVREILLRVLIIVVYLAYAFGYLSIYGLVACFVGVYGLSALIIFFYISRIGSVSLKHDNRFISKSLRSNYFSYTSFILLGSLGGTLISKIDALMITSGMGLASTGIYSVAFYMISIIDIPSRSITAISSPLAAECLKSGKLEKTNELYKKVSLNQLLVGSFIFVMIWINIDNIYKIIPNGEIFVEGKWVVLFMGIAKIVEMTIGFGGILISFSKYYKWTLYFSFFISGITIFLNYILIPIWGITGAAIATVLSCMVSYSIQQWIVMKKIKGNPYSKGTLTQIFIILFLLGINYLLPKLLNTWADGIYRTTIIFVVGIFLIVKLKVSEEINSFMQTAIRKITQW